MYRGPGAVSIEDAPDPGPPAPGELLVAVSRAAICGTDAAEWLHGPILARPPVILGHEFTGVVAALGDDVADFAIGERVVSGAGVSCGRCRWCAEGRTNLCERYYTLGLHAHGGLAELVRTPADICLKVPDALSDTAAAMAQPLAVALHSVRRSGAGAGRSCLVLGAGGIGAFIIAAAAAAGSSPLVAVDIDDERLEVARSLGATLALDARDSDVAEAVADLTGGVGVDVTIEATGVPSNVALALEATRRGGDVAVVGLQSRPVEVDLLAVTVREIDLHGTLAHVCSLDLVEALALLGSTTLAVDVLDREIDLEDLVEAGIRPLAEGRAKGKIVVRVAPGGADAEKGVDRAERVGSAR